MNHLYNENSLRIKFDKKNLKYYILYAIIILSLFISIYVKEFVYISFIISILYLMFFDSIHSNKLIFFLLPFASIMKISSGQISFYSLLLLVYVLLFIIKNFRKPYNFSFFILPLILIVYSLININLNRTLNLFLGIIIIFIIYCTENKKTYINLLLMFIMGILISSILAYIVKDTSRFTELIRLTYIFNGGDLSYRFSGFEADPNYYTINIVVALSSLIMLKFNNNIKGSFYIIVTLLIVLGMMTLSKSFILIFFFLFIFFIIKQLKYNFRSGILILFLAITVFLIAINTFAKEQYIVLMNRFLNVSFENFDINSFTTGRFDLWKSYIDYFGANIFSLIFGSGLGAPYVNNYASHNMYIEIIFRYGLVGGFIFIWTIINFFKQFKSKNNNKNKMGLLPIIVFMIMGFFLDFILSDTFYFILCILISNCYMIESNDLIKKDIKFKRMENI